MMQVGTIRRRIPPGATVDLRQWRGPESLTLSFPNQWFAARAQSLVGQAAGFLSLCWGWGCAASRTLFFGPDPPPGLLLRLCTAIQY